MSAHEEFVIERSHRSKNLVLVGHAKDDGECMSTSRELCHYLHDCAASTWILVIQLKDEYRVQVASDVIQQLGAYMCSLQLGMLSRRCR
jgi:hypothetical protein